jgi:hypothetical protein
MFALVPFSILCGFALSGFLVVALKVLGLLSPSRTKQVVLGSILVTTIIASAAILYVALSPTPEVQIQEELTSLPQYSQSLLLFEHTYSSSSATGKCGNTTTEQLYGHLSENSAEYLLGWYDKQLSSSGWRRERTVWLKETNVGFFTLHLEVFSDALSLDPNQWYYMVPEGVLAQAAEYPSAYMLSMNLIYRSSRERCFTE